MIIDVLLRYRGIVIVIVVIVVVAVTKIPQEPPYKHNAPPPAPLVDLTPPSLGADMDDGTLLQWKVAVGDRVHRGQIVAIDDTAKAAVGVESWHEGTVQALVEARGGRLETREATGPLGAPVRAAFGVLGGEGVGISNAEQLPLRAEPVPGKFTYS